MNRESGIVNQEPHKIKSFIDLDAWWESHKLVLQIYELAKRFPRDELFGLVSQLRRCAVSITSNIAEGFSRESWKEKLQFYAMALGSVTELQNQLLIARDVGYLTRSQFDTVAGQSVKAHKILAGLIKKTKTKIVRD